ncbi:hypothetical protein [Chryseobacterium polytrichastri]|uniref:Uncharacterized protein n=1 Tax=Chryseobacterium polytrichastri TaxID=1302687 RepID=A0A1M7FSF9_9FLAO|nr:hypothetical protein [Chryseobacterium polytrichastri]SHM06718.1 hypothetical protein SAMN05444267_103325 [Chryseobacterium polytrichastri]
MIFQSRYRIEFSKPKEEILNKIENNLYKKFFDWDKSFKGRVTSEGFNLKYVSLNLSPKISGDFRKDEQGKEKLLLTISFGFLNLLAVLFATLFTFFIAFLFTLFVEKYAWIFILIFYAIYIQSIRIYWISSKDEVLEYLRNLDKLCEVSSLNN